MSLRSALLALALISAGVLAFVFATLGTVVLLVDRNSGSSDGATPVTASNANDQVAVRRNNEAIGPGGSPVKVRAYFLDAIPRH